MGQNETKQRLQALLEEALGRKLPEVGTHEFNRLLVEMGQRDPQILAVVNQALRSAVSSPSASQPQVGPSPSSKEEVLEKVLRRERSSPPTAPPQESGKGGDVEEKAKAQTPEPAPGVPPSQKEGEKAPPQKEARETPPPKAPFSGAKKGAVPQRGYESFRKKVESKQRAEKGIRRLLQIFEPNLRTYVPHPKKVMLIVALVVSPLALFWVFEQNIRSFFARRGDVSQAVAPPATPAPVGISPEQSLPPPPPPNQEGEGEQGEGGAPAPETPAPSAQGEQAPQQAPQGSGGEANPAPQAPQDSQGFPSPPPPSPPPPPQLPVYGEELPPPPAQGQGAAGAPPQEQAVFKRAATEGSGPLRKDLSQGAGGEGTAILKRQGGEGQPLVGGVRGGGGGEGGGATATPSGPLVVRKGAEEGGLGPTHKGPTETRPLKAVRSVQEGIGDGEGMGTPSGTLETAPSQTASAARPASSPSPTAPSTASASLGTSGATSSPPSSAPSEAILPLPPSWQSLAAETPTARTPTGNTTTATGGSSQGGNQGNPQAGRSAPVPVELPLRYGEILRGKVVTGIVMAEGTTESPILIALKGKDGKEIVVFGSATLNPRTNRVNARFDRAYVDNIAYVISGYLVDSRGTLGIYARVSEEAPNVAVNLLRGAFGGLRQYVDYYTKATTTTVIPGTGVVTSSAPPPLGLTVLASALGQLAAPPDQVSIVRVWSVDPGTEVGVVVTPPASPTP